jgi:hypothetical protein
LVDSAFKLGFVLGSNCWNDTPPAHGVIVGGTSLNNFLVVIESSSVSAYSKFSAWLLVEGWRSWISWSSGIGKYPLALLNVLAFSFLDSVADGSSTSSARLSSSTSEDSFKSAVIDWSSWSSGWVEPLAYLIFLFAFILIS